ncbi:protein phosphatase CheZ [Azospirillum sp. SYSU D00513]|uniref:protein phosphatase CheZ n=1 Tax=Azospirillum sp. SYSU D00513 TaxID=2812561 RepID=UPI001A9733D0|nr:protein phosphatase CheZ [Azospirillum sp. SYSU D00513]
MKHTSKPFMAELQQARRTGNPYQSALADSPQPGPAAPALALEGPAAAPVAVDHSEVLRAIHDLGSKLDRFLTLDNNQIEQIQVDIADISGRIKATKMEMAAIRHPLAGEDRFQQASQELGAVVSATEAATNSIMACAEELEEVVQEVKASLPEGYHASRVGDMNDIIVRIYEACNFQDLTGQRITKVCKALGYIEERVDAMMSLWNKREFESMPLPPSTTKVDEGLELHGPSEAQETGSISQADIDALFA